MEKPVVAVVGGGLSGLSAANALLDQGVEVLVFEAGDRVGGRTLTKPLEPTPINGFGWVDLGGAFVGPSQNAVLGLIKKFGLKTYQIHAEQDWVVYSQGQRTRYNGQWPVWRNPLAWWDLVRATKKFEEMVWQVPHDEPWNCRYAREWDSMTVEEWMNRQFWTKEARAYFEAQVCTNVTDSPCQLSMLWYLWYVRSAGGSYRIWNATGGAQESKIIGGSQAISFGLASSLGERVLKNKPVVSINYSTSERKDGVNGVVVKTLSGEEYNVSCVVIAMPLPTQNSISYNPPISARRRQLIQRVHMGMCVKSQLYYKSPFWREHGVNGFASCVDSNMFIHNVVDDGVPGITGGAITIFIFGKKALEISAMDVEDRKRTLGGNLAECFGLEDFNKVIGYEDQSWFKEPYIGGCYTTCYPPGVMHLLGSELRNPASDEAGNPKVFWAGSETATLWTGYMDGAIRAGRRAASEALKSLGKVSKLYTDEDEDVNPVIPVPELHLSFLERLAPPVPLVAAAMFGFVPVVAVASLSVYTKRSPMDMLTEIGQKLFSRSQ